MRWYRGIPVDAVFELGYSAVHKRLGDVSVHRCTDCGEQAHDWSYIGGSPDEKVDQRRRSGSGVYTTDLSYYVPRCRDCHMKLDMRGEDNPSAKLTWEQVYAIRETYTGVWGQQTALARKYGVTQTTISKIVLNKTYIGRHVSSRG
jgi:hypothetical protein